MAVLAEAVFLFRFEVIVGAVVIDDLVASLAKFQTAPVYVRLDVVAFLREDGQRPVYLMNVDFRLFYKALCILQRRQLGTRIKYPCEEQHLKYFVQVVLVPVALLYLSAYLVQTQFVIHFLEKEISAIVTALGVLVNECGGIALQYYLLPVLFFLSGELGNVLLASPMGSSPRSASPGPQECRGALRIWWKAYRFRCGNSSEHNRRAACPLTESLES